VAQILVAIYNSSSI